MTITITALNKADLLSQVADLTGGVVSSGNGAASGGGTAPALTGDASPDPSQWSPEKVTAVYFPADPALAKFPSPEGSKCVCDPDGTIHGRPYVISATGGIYTFKKGVDGKGAVYPLGAGDTRTPGHVLLLNGNAGFPNNGYYDITIAEGMAYLHVAPGGQTLITTAPDSPGSGTTVTTIPTLWTNPFFGSYTPPSNGQTGGGASGGTSGGNVGGVPMPPEPPAPAVQPGSSGKVLKFGTGQTYAGPTAALAAAAPGDTVLFAGTPGQVFAESFDVPEGVKFDAGGRWSDLVKLAAAVAAKDLAAIDALYVPGAVIDGDTLADPDGYSHQLGGLIAVGNCNISGCRIKNFGMKEAGHGGTGGIRPKGSMVGQMQGSHNYITNCQNGIGPGGAVKKVISGPWTETVLVNNGLPDGSGGSHNIYDANALRSIAGPNFFSIMLPFTATNFDGGHPFKSRANDIHLVAPFHLIGSDSSALDMPNGTTVVAQIGTGKIEQIAGSQNHTLVGYGVENQLNGVAGVKLNGTVLIASCDSPLIIAQGPVDATSAVKQGNPIGSQGGGKVTGL